MSGTPARRVVVCGTGFGRLYLQALAEGRVPGMQLAGILARGSERSRSCARRYDVPLHTHPEQLPADIEVAVVAVYSGVNGGPGSELARALLQRGIHVVQEGPLHHDELAETLRTARHERAQYHVSTHYPQVEPVRRFVGAVEALRRHQELEWVELTCGLQVFYHSFDVLRAALGRVLPVEIDEQVVRRHGFVVLGGTVGGIPVLMQVQNQMHLSDPDNHAHYLHRIVVGSAAGQLTLLGTHGPVFWSARPHFPAAGRGAERLDEVEAAHLDVPSAEAWGDTRAPSFREITGTLWPEAAGRTLGRLGAAIDADADPLQHGQGDLAVSTAWQTASRCLGDPELHERPEPAPLALETLAGGR